MRFVCATLLMSLLSSLGSASLAQELAPNAPPDKLVDINHGQLQKFDAAIAPYVKQARATLPLAKQKFLQGLPKGEIFFVTTRVYGEPSSFEQVFVRVTSWKGQTIRGRLASETPYIHRKVGETIICTENDVLDWTISKPDGSEEGNFVGKFLDTYKPSN
jgi:hypothetical protein